MPELPESEFCMIQKIWQFIKLHIDIYMIMIMKQGFLTMQNPGANILAYQGVGLRSYIKDLLNKRSLSYIHKLCFRSK